MSTDYLEELERLQALREKGALSEEDFEQAKARLLERVSSPPPSVPERLGQQNAARETCSRCRTGGQTKLFCESCGLFLPDDSGTVERVTYTRRFFGNSLLETLLLLVTLIIGWYIWLAMTASTAQSPAKRLLKVYVIDTDTLKAVSGGRMWVREVLVKQVLANLIGLVTGVVGLVDSIWVFPDKNRQTLHDKLVSTVVVYAPYGLPEKLGGQGLMAQQRPAVADVAEQLRELAKLRDEGILTPQEYEQKRSQLASKL
jgi:uncharacterized RDD family membrane protein YckC